MPDLGNGIGEHPDIVDCSTNEQWEEIKKDHVIRSKSKIFFYFYRIGKKFMKKDTGESKINPDTGLDILEQECMDRLLDSFSVFIKMDRQHSDELKDFVDGVHKIQDLLACRVVRRVYPKGWKNISKKKVKEKEESYQVSPAEEIYECE